MKTVAIVKVLASVSQDIAPHPMSVDPVAPHRHLPIIVNVQAMMTVLRDTVHQTTPVKTLVP